MGQITIRQPHLQESRIMPCNNRIFLGLVLAFALSFLVVDSCLAQDVQGSSPSKAPYRTELHALAGRVLTNADKAGCRRDSCTVLVANFTNSSGATSSFGIQLADSISLELLALGSGIKVIDRSRLRAYLARERIPSNSLKDEKAARWLASEFHASAVLIGNMEERDARLRLRVELLDVSKGNKGPFQDVELSLADSKSDLAPLEPYDAEIPVPSGSSTQTATALRAGVEGVGVPVCLHCPAPKYTDAARKAKFHGSITLLVTVTEEGRAVGISVVKGVPFDLNEAAIQAVSMWKFTPATSGGAPVPVSIPIEITFRLY